MNRQLSPRLIGAAFVAIVVLLVGIPTASAHLFYDRPDFAPNYKKRFAFLGMTFESALPEKSAEVDPLSIVFSGGNVSGISGALSNLCADQKKRSAGCAAAHVATDWREDNAMRYNSCNIGNQRVVFPEQGWSGKNDETNKYRSDYADRTLGTRPLVGRGCGTQYHTRIWDDREHRLQVSDASHEGHEWAVAGVHHEKVGKHNGRRHTIDMEWETAERVMINRMGTRGPNTGGVEGERHCTYPDFQPLPGTAGKHQGKYSNGFVSRISWQHIDDGGCNGA